MADCRVRALGTAARGSTSVGHWLYAAIGCSSGLDYLTEPAPSLEASRLSLSRDFVDSATRRPASTASRRVPYESVTLLGPSVQDDPVMLDLSHADVPVGHSTPKFSPEPRPESRRTTVSADRATCRVLSSGVAP